MIQDNYSVNIDMKKFPELDDDKNYIGRSKYSNRKKLYSVIIPEK